MLGLNVESVSPGVRAKRGERLPVVLSMPETVALLGAMSGTPRLMAALIYGGGLRVSECCELRIKDLDFEAGRISVLGAKGGKDRMVAMPCSVMELLRGQLEFSRHIWQQDFRNQMPVKLPGNLARKAPDYRFAWPWAWVFPGHQPCRDPRTGEMVRWRMHEVNVQRAVRQARRALGIMVLPHELRHGYATHALSAGANIKAVALAMGHTNIETTAGYCHAEACGIRSPLDTLACAENILPMTRAVPAKFA